MNNEEPTTPEVADVPLSDKDREHLTSLIRPLPEHMYEVKDVKEYCLQTQVEGMLNGMSHFKYIDIFNTLIFDREYEVIDKGIADGHKYMIVGMVHGIVIPIYWASREWSIDIGKAWLYSTAKGVTWWQNKIYQRYENYTFVEGSYRRPFFQILLIARQKGANETP